MLNSVCICVFAISLCTAMLFQSRAAFAVAACAWILGYAARRVERKRQARRQSEQLAKMAAIYPELNDDPPQGLRTSDALGTTRYRLFRMPDGILIGEVSRAQLEELIEWTVVSNDMLVLVETLDVMAEHNADSQLINLLREGIKPDGGIIRWYDVHVPIKQ
ncbi:MAG: hypothetical protein J5I93_21665 [Pirellulaceae bacterium]|nr:hypothetical protein [Pirellulaceae bacterium]